MTDQLLQRIQKVRSDYSPSEYRVVKGIPTLGFSVEELDQLILALQTRALDNLWMINRIEYLQGQLQDAWNRENRENLVRRSDVWYWEPGEENFLDSLNCDVVIDAGVLRQLIQGGQK